MVVVATEAFKIYRHGVVAEIAEGQEFSGEMADYLLDGGCPVRLVEAEAPEPQSPAQPPPKRGDATGDSGPSGSVPGPGAEGSSDSGDGQMGQTEPGAGAAPSTVDVSGSAKDVLAWVDGDPEKAAEAAEAESAREKPRSTLLAKLDEITKG